MENTTPVSQKILHLSVAALCLAASALAITALVEVRHVSAVIIDYVTDARDMQRAMSVQAQDATDLVSEAVLYGTATLLEQNRALPHSDAAKIKSDAIEHIAKKSERWGKIIKAVDEAPQRLGAGGR